MSGVSLIGALLAVAFLCGVVNFYFSIQILRRVAEHDGKMNFFEIRWQVHKKMKPYCRLTRAEQGRIGNAFYGYWISLILLVTAILLSLSLLSAGSNGQ
jgi:hypothetical protein